MATASVTLSNWNSTNSWENLADAGNSTRIAYSRDATDAAAKFSGSFPGTLPTSGTEHARSPTTTDTWASIFGISSAALVTSYRVSAWKGKLIYDDVGAALSIGVTDPNGSNAWVSADSNNTGSVSGASVVDESAYTAQTAGAARTVDSDLMVATTPVRFWFACSGSAPFGESASFDVRLDDVTFEITWSNELTAIRGSFTLTGQNAGFRVSRQMAMAQGSIALTGQAAGLIAARRLTCAAGTFALTGQASTLKASRTLALGQGSFAMTGQDARVLRGVPMVADGATFALTGQDATLKVTRQLVCAQGSFSLAGQNALLTFLYRLAMEQGSLALTGQDAGLRATRQLTCATGTYTSTGQAALVHRVMAAGCGTFTFTGQAASIKRKMTASHGTYALTGNAATFRYYYRTTSPRRIRVEAQANTVTVRSRA